MRLHAQLEEQFFYPEAQKALKQERNLVDEARVEHATLKWLITQLENETAESELHAAKVKVLQDYVKNHVREEEKELFPKLRKSGLDLNKLGKILFERKMQLHIDQTGVLH